MKITNIAINGIIKTTSDISLVLISDAIESSAQAGFKDERIGKLAGGIFLMFSGLYVLYESGLFNILKTKNLKIFTNEKIPKGEKIFLAGVALLGVASTCIGIYSIILGLFELTIGNQTRDRLYYASNHLKNSKKDSPIRDCEFRLEEAKQKILDCPFSRELVNAVAAKGPFSVQCETKEMNPTGASVDIYERKIFIADIDQKMVPPLLFELVNLQRSEEYTKLQQTKCEKRMHVYADQMEKLEYNTAKITNEISQQCVKIGRWSKDLVVYADKFDPKNPNSWNSLDGYLQYQEKRGHTDLYRKAWINHCAPDKMNELMIDNTPKQVAKKVHKEEL